MQQERINKVYFYKIEIYYKLNDAVAPIVNISDVIIMGWCNDTYLNNMFVT